MFKNLHRNIQIRIYTSFMSRVVGSMVFPFMAIYFTKELNAIYAGILLLIQLIVQFIASLYGGYLADSIGRKKMMVIGEWMKVLAFAGMIVANSPAFTSAWVTFLMLLVMSISTGFINPAAEAMLIDVSTKENRALMYSINYWAVNLSIMLGLIIGGWFFQTHFFQLLISLLIISFVTLWMTKSLIQETFSITAVEEKRSEDSYGIRSIIQSYRTVINNVPFVLFTLGGIAILSIEFQRNNFIAIRLEEEFPTRVVTLLGDLNITLDGVKLLSLLTVENTLIIVFFTVVFTKWIKGKSVQKVMYFGFLLFGLGYSILAFSNNLTLLFIGVVVLSVGELMYVPTRQSLLAEIVDDSRRGAYMAFNGFVFQIGKIFGVLGIMVGEVLNGIGIGIVCVLFAFLGMFFSRWALMKRDSKRKVILTTKVISR
ncbi:MDR family MFS transporter [Lysinibacillus sp. NPDC056185]|uniref:MDR family MFS transporter n=1 Tax=Lysinibacillus sp. NPDC056185 TaxID=3345739 RepID=UPI0039EE809D